MATPAAGAPVVPAAASAVAKIDSSDIKEPPSPGDSAFGSGASGPTLMKDAKDVAKVVSAATAIANAAGGAALPGTVVGGGADKLAELGKEKKKVMIKVGMVGDQQIGKTTLMVKYVEGKFSEDYIQTLGVNFMEKTISLKSTDITFSIWDLGGHQDYFHMLPLVCNDAFALLFMFDLSRKATLSSVKTWYKQARALNKTAAAFLIGTKYDFFATMKQEDKTEITKQAIKFARAMKAPLIFCSSSHSINIKNIFKIVVSKVFDLKCDVKKIDTIGDPIIDY